MNRPRLEGLAREIGVSDRVRLVGALPRETLIGAYRMADLFVMPSTGEGLGVAFLEAMACGTPVLGLDVAGARDALCERRTRSNGRRKGVSFGTGTHDREFRS